MWTTICTAASARISTAVAPVCCEHAAHDQPERNRGQDDREAEADHIALAASRAAGRSRRGHDMAP